MKKNDNLYVDDTGAWREEECVFKHTWTEMIHIIIHRINFLHKSLTLQAHRFAGKRADLKVEVFYQQLESEALLCSR